MKKVLIIVLFLIFGLLPANAENWTQVGSNVYMDLDSIKPYINNNGVLEKGKYLFIAKTLNDGRYTNLEKEFLNNQKIEYFLDETIIDLNSKKYAEKSSKTYGLNNKLLTSDNSDDLDWHDIKTLNSTVGYMYNIITSYAAQINK